VERLATLQAVEAEVWHQLEAAAAERGHGWRTAVLATTDGQRADARTVVLREVDAANRHLCFYSDRRGAKVAQLTSHPDATLVMWCSALGWQLRCRVRLALEAPGPATTLRWARIKGSPAAQDYLSPLPPGTALGTEPDEPPSPSTARNFAVIRATPLSLDWLELHRSGHRRALFDDRGPRWVQP
jgi:pyridoxamine 5'-phosphate oxidase